MATTKKKSYIARLGILALALTIMSTCLLGGTMAKYTSTVTGTASAPVAEWSFSVNGSDATITENISLLDTATTFSNVAEAKVAPGTSGSFDIVIDGTGSDVAIDYKIKLTGLMNIGQTITAQLDPSQPSVPTNLVFYDEGMEPLDRFTLTYTGITGTIPLPSADVELEEGEEPQKVTRTIYWSWPYGDSEPEENDSILESASNSTSINYDRADTALGVAAGNMSFGVVVTGTQAAPVGSTTSPEN